MKLQIVINKDRDEEILIYVHEKTPLVCEIEKLVNNNSFDLTGYGETETVLLRTIRFMHLLKRVNTGLNQDFIS